MKLITIITLTLCIFTPFISYGNQNESKALAETYLVVTKQKEQNNKLLEMLKAQLPQQAKIYTDTEKLNAKQKKLFGKYMDEMTTILIEEIAWEKIKDNHIKIISSIYSDEELKSLITFFESDLGRLYINKQQRAFQMLGESSQKSMHNFMRRIKALEQKMKEDLGK